MSERTVAETGGVAPRLAAALCGGLLMVCTDAEASRFPGVTGDIVAIVLGVLLGGWVGVMDVVFHATRNARFWAYAIPSSALIGLAMLLVLAMDRTYLLGLPGLAVAVAAGWVLPWISSLYPMPHGQRSLCIVVFAVIAYLAWLNPNTHLGFFLLAPALSIWALCAALAPAKQPDTVVRARPTEGARRGRQKSHSRRMPSNDWTARFGRSTARLGAAIRSLQLSMLMLAVLLFLVTHFGAFLTISLEWEPLASLFISFATLSPMAPMAPVGGEPAAAYWLSYGIWPSLVIAGLLAAVWWRVVRGSGGQ